MKPFIHNDFLLSSETAKTLYHNAAASLPIIDFHNHLSPAAIYEDRSYNDLTEVWLNGDHYKWRAMRANGIPERLITGDGCPYEKFLAWADTVQNCIGNPLYHWTHLELNDTSVLMRLCRLPPQKKYGILAANSSKVLTTR